MTDFYITTKGKRIELPRECEHDADARVAFIAEAEGGKATKPTKKDGD